MDRIYSICTKVQVWEIYHFFPQVSMKKKIFCCFGSLLFFSAISQTSTNPEEILIYQSDNYVFQSKNTYSIDVGLKYNDASQKAHPDFGTLPWDAPQKNVVEDLSKRKIDERYYIDLNSPSYFYIQKSAVPINYEKDGWMIAIDPKLNNSSTGIYTAKNQPYPTCLNTNDRNTAIEIGEHLFSFNNYKLKATDMNGSVAEYNADWSSVEVGNNGAYIANIFPHIDMKISFKEGAVKSDFIINSELPYKHIVFTDQLGFDESLYSISSTDDLGLNLMIKRNSDAIDIMKIGMVRSYDASGIKEHSNKHAYIINGNYLSFECDSSWLHNNEMVYPLVIDPIFIAVGPITGGVTGSLPAPAFCSDNINLTFPGGSMPWDVSAGWVVFSNFCYYNFLDCWRSEAQIRIRSSCGGLSPNASNHWMCAPNCNSWGTWNPVLPFNASGTQSLAQCYTPSCSDQSMEFTIELSRTYCPSYSPYDMCDWSYSTCQSLEGWQVTVQGRTVETPEPISLNPSPCIGNVPLTAEPDYGVPGYTYLWSTGATTQSIDVSDAGTYTVVVTDACGVQATQEFTIACPLSIDLKDFSVVKAGEKVLVKWETLNEYNNDYFTIERMTDDSKKWEKIGTVKGSENSVENIIYKFYDNTPYQRGFSYYRLKQTDLNGEYFYFEPKVINFSKGNKIRIFPQPATNQLIIEWDGFDGDIHLSSLLGEKILLPMYKEGISYIIDTSHLSSGVYIVVLSIDGESITTQRVIIK